MTHRNLPSFRRSLAIALCLCLPPVVAQGNFVNFEAPVAKGIAVAQPSSGGAFVLACNTDDNAVVIVDAATSAVLARVAVGQSPVSVLYDAAASRIYTVNFIGDSVTAITFPVTGTNPPQARLDGTFWVGDAPTDAVIDAVSGLIIVVCSGSRELAAFNPGTLAPAGRETIGVPNGSGGYTVVMQMPWRILQRPTGEFVILNQRSGSHIDSIVSLFASVGLDLIERSLQPPGSTTSVPATPVLASGQVPAVLGTSNMGMALAPDGRLFVVGNDARNDLPGGEPTLRSHPTGFVESGLWRLEPPPGQTAFKARDLNVVSGNAVAASDSASMPTDIVLRINSDKEGGGEVVTVYVASFSTDRIIQLDASSGTAPADWPRKFWQLTPRTGYAMAGPRSLALATVGGSEMLFVLDRLDASVRAFPVQANGDLLMPGTTINLQDPFPLQHRLGQSLLYDARRSGTGKVSCASCHIDGRTDSLPWKLDSGSGSPVPIPPERIDGVTENPGVTHWPVDRGPMITQSLQGLRPHPIEVLGLDLAPLLTTEPFYWRAVRDNFEAFGPPFQNLMGGSIPTDMEMTAYREFAFTIMYPPNPEQPLTRTFGGATGESGNPADGSGALRGMKLYHERSLVASATGATSPYAVVFAGGMTGGRSCVHCHSLPTGTNERITITFLDGQPIKTAQLRGLRAREAVHVGFSLLGSNPTTYGPGGSGNPFFPVNSDGLFHNGFTSSVNDLIHSQFTPVGDTTGSGAAVTAFVRQLDTGVAPIVGLSVSVTSANLGPATDAAVRLAEEQVEAGNADLVVRRRVGGVTTNLFYNALRQRYTDPTNPTSTTVVFRGPSHPVGDPPVLPTSLASGDLIVFEAVPVGSGRRIASPSGTLVVQSNSAPTITVGTSSRTGLIVPPMWQPILQFAAHVSPGNWAGAGTGPKTALAATAFHEALASAGGFGVTDERHHEAPRRIRIEGANIQLGAKLELWLPIAWSTSTPPVVTAWTAATFDLNPVLDAGSIVFETSATIDPLNIAAMQCGWIAAPGVQSLLDSGALPSGVSLDPTNHNQFNLRVLNENPGGAVASSVLTSLVLK